jgi:ATP-dependent DNA helicase DinG
MDMQSFNISGTWESGGMVDQAHIRANRQYIPRPHQQEMAGLIEQALARQETQKIGILPIEAGTGIGKTLAYLVPGVRHAAERAGQILVSTHTLALGDQIMRKDGTLACMAAEPYVGFLPKVAHRRGMRHFISPDRARSIGNLLREDGEPPSVWQHFITIADKADTAFDPAKARLDARNFDGDVQALIDGNLMDFIERDLGFDLPKDDIMVLRSSPDRQKTVYNLAHELAQRATLLVTTHAYSATMLSRSALRAEGGEAFDIMVVDEADQWSNAASGVAMTRLSFNSLKLEVAALQKATRHSPDANNGTMEGRFSQIIDLIDDLTAYAPSEAGRRVDLDQGRPEIVLLHTLVNKIQSILKITDQWKAYTASAGDRLRESLIPLSMILKSAKDTEGFWTVAWLTSRVEKAPTLAVFGKAPGRIMKKLWNKEGAPVTRTMILTSATLTTPGYSETGKWKSMEIGTGVDLDSPEVLRDLMRSIHPKRFGTMRVRFAHPSAPVPRIEYHQDQDGTDFSRPDAASVGYAAQVIRKAIKESLSRQGRTLVLVPSYGDVTPLMQAIVPPDGVTMIGPARGTPVHKVLEAYHATPYCCLITPALWVGADLPGMVQSLVITRIPFPPQAEGTNINSFPGVIDHALRKLAQGIGRGIRCETDDVTLWIADPRFPIPASITDATT